MKIAIKGYHTDATYQMKLLLKSATAEVIEIKHHSEECAPDVDVCVVHIVPACWKKIIEKTKCLLWLYENYTKEMKPQVAQWLAEIDAHPNFLGYIDPTGLLKTHYPNLKKKSFSFTLNYANYPLLETSGSKIVSLIKRYPRYWPKQWEQAKTITSEDTLYGDDNPAGTIDDRRALREAKFLLHLKPTGSTCQAVVKAIASGVPVLTDEATWKAGLFDNYTSFMAVPPFKSYTEIRPWLDALTDAKYAEIKQKAVKLAEHCRKEQHLDISFFNYNEFVFPNDNHLKIKVPFGHLYNCYAERRDHEPGFRKAVSWLLSKGIIGTKGIIDLGAWIGDNSVPWAIQMRGGTVFAIDPSKSNCDWIQKVADINNVKSALEYFQERPPLVIMPYAIAEKHKALTTNDNLFHASFVWNAGGDKPKHRVLAWSLDEMLAYNRFKVPIEFIHLDVEGMEQTILDGAVKLIAKDRPIITIEQHLEIDKWRDTVKWMGERSYDVYIINEILKGNRHDCRNFFCIPRENAQAWAGGSEVPGVSFSLV